MKILFYIESLRSGGKERRLVELIKGLKRVPGVDMELVLTKEEIHYTGIFETGIKIHYTLRNGLKREPHVFREFYKITKEFKPDIIHVWGALLTVYTIPSKLFFNSYIINSSITYAASIPRLSKFSLISKFSFLMSNIVTSNSLAGLKTHKKKISSKYRVVYNGYDISRNKVSKTDLHKLLGLSKDAVLIGMIATFNNAKDYKTFIDSASAFIHQQVFFLSIGDGPKKKEYEDYVKNKNISNLLFLGKRNDIENICQNLDIGVLLSNTIGHAEGISNSIMEYMANKLPVVATDAGGTPELVVANETGYLIKPFDTVSLNEKIKYLINNPETGVTFGDKGKLIIEKEFSLKKMVKEFLNIYQERVKL
jgi:glycosyltransferase involved in cell wall biosynthesis